MSTTGQGSFGSSKNIVNGKTEPDHLLVLVHGILASPSDWTYVEAELKRRLGRNFLIYASSCNTYTKTSAGIDGAGKRLADEVKQVVKRTESLKRISFLAHSVRGLFARYAVAVLYSPNNLIGSQSDDVAESTGKSETSCPSRQGMIAGLEPINFITLASPHLGVRRRKQVCSVGSALGAFRCRIVYANVSYDHMVGWRTSSVRRETELVKPPLRSLDGYKHVVDVEYCPSVSSDGPRFPPEAIKAKEAA
ncbi:hypothetical protein SLA2020_405950 [Shorea laevis]